MKEKLLDDVIYGSKPRGVYGKITNGGNNILWLLFEVLDN